jgi:hypothetical protein
MDMVCLVQRLGQHRLQAERGITFMLEDTTGQARDMVFVVQTLGQHNLLAEREDTFMLADARAAHSQI